MWELIDIRRSLAALGMTCEGLPEMERYCMKKIILLVDDSATARALFKMFFMDHPEYEIIEASQWEDAVKKAQSCHPFIIALDYNMPEKSGSELARIMQEKGIKAHYVLVTANMQKSVLDEVGALGFSGTIEKPVTAESIQALLDRLT
jgi:CheY-like chemotaxis protein